MSEFFLGLYWQNRPITLRQYAYRTKQFLVLLQETHSVFQSMAWVGNRPGSAVKLGVDLSDLDDLVYRHSWNRERTFEPHNVDGSPTWETLAPLGYHMSFSTMCSDARDSVDISIHAGSPSSISYNAITIGYPAVRGEKFPYPEFYDYEFLLSLFEKSVRYWAPSHGLLTSHTFLRTLQAQGLPRVGWLTYLRDAEAGALRGERAMAGCIVEALDVGGVLIALDREFISPTNSGQLQKANMLNNWFDAKNKKPLEPSPRELPALDGSQ
jgi:hypothetical protein